MPHFLVKTYSLIVDNSQKFWNSISNFYNFRKNIYLFKWIALELHSKYFRLHLCVVDDIRKLHF